MPANALSHYPADQRKLRAPGGKNSSDDVRAVLAYRAAPSPETADAALKAVAPILRKGAKIYGGDDGAIMYGRARKIAIGVLHHYTPETSSLPTFLMSHLRGLQRERAQMEMVGGAPERQLADRRLLTRSENTLRDELGRMPSFAEIADHSGVSLKRLARARAYRPGTTTGEMSARALSEGGDDAQAVEGPDLTTARAEYLYPGASPLDQLVMEHTLGLHGAERLPKGEIARRAGVSAARVSQRSAAIQAQLDELAAKLPL